MAAVIESCYEPKNPAHCSWLALRSAVRMGGDTDDQLECLNERADAVVANGETCFRD